MLGTMTWGEQNTEAEAQAQLDYAIGEGINFIDTAEMYPVPPNERTQGRTETYLGTWLARQQRDRLFVATKVAGPGRRDWIRNGRTDLTPDVIADAVDTASNACRPITSTCTNPLAATQRTEFRRDRVRSLQGKGRPHDSRAGGRNGGDDQGGKIRYYGLSNETAGGYANSAVRPTSRRSRPSHAPEQLQPALAHVDNDLAETLLRESMSLLAYSPLAAGILSGKYIGGAKPAGTRFTLFDSLGLRFRKPMVSEAVDAYAALAKRRGLTLVQLALGYVASRWFMGASIIGATSMSQLKEDIPRRPRARQGDAGRDQTDSVALSESGGVRIRDEGVNE